MGEGLVGRVGTLHELLWCARGVDCSTNIRPIKIFLNIFVSRRELSSVLYKFPRIVHQNFLRIAHSGRGNYIVEQSEAYRIGVLALAQRTLASSLHLLQFIFLLQAYEPQSMCKVTYIVLIKGVDPSVTYSDSSYIHFDTVRIDGNFRILIENKCCHRWDVVTSMGFPRNKYIPSSRN